MSETVLVPLDERPCCLQFVERLAEIAGISLQLPPRALLGRFQRPGDWAAVLEWYRHHREADQAIVSLDMLAFGGLVASRRPEVTLEEARQRLLSWLDVAASGPAVSAFQVLLRTAPTQTTPEETILAQQIVDLSVLEARAAAGESGLESAIAELRDRIDGPFLARYLATRERNHRLNLQAVEWSNQERLRDLLIAIDDSKTHGWNILEAQRLGEQIQSRSCWIAPGTDEAAQLLLARACRAQPRAIQVVWSHPQLSHVVTRYEDRPLERLIQAQMGPAGLVSGDDSPWQLFVYGFPGPQGEAEEQVVRSVDPAFLERLDGSLSQGRRVVVADVAHANGGDLMLGRALSSRLERLLGYAAWNTAGNTLGTALSLLGCAPEQPDAQQRAAIRRFREERWLDDLVYQGKVRALLKRQLGSPGLTLDADQQRFCEQQLPDRLRDVSLELGHQPPPLRASLPWGRLFEIEVEVA